MRSHSHLCLSIILFFLHVRSRTQTARTHASTHTHNRGACSHAAGTAIGAGLLISTSPVQVNGATIQDNQVSGGSQAAGGGLVLQGGVTGSLTGLTIVANSASRGAGVFWSGNNAVTLTQYRLFRINCLPYISG